MAENVANSTLILPELEKPHKMTAQEYAYQRLRNAIMVGSIAPGVPVTIRGLAQIMSLSPTPVREALRRLSSQNALMVLENRRIVVPHMTKERFHELVSLRSALECYASERALPFISESLIDEIERLDHMMDEEVKSDNLDRLVALNQQFHTRLFCANPNQISMPMIESVWLQLGPFMRIALDHMGTFYKVDRHKQVIASLRARDLDGFKTAINADIHDAVGRLDDLALEKILASGKGDTPALEQQ